MKVKYSIKRYGTYEYREADIDLEQAVRDEVASTVSCCAGFEDDALETIEIDYTETVKNMP